MALARRIRGDAHFDHRLPDDYEADPEHVSLPYFNEREGMAALKQHLIKAKK